MTTGRGSTPGRPRRAALALGASVLLHGLVASWIAGLPRGLERRLRDEDRASRAAVTVEILEPAAPSPIEPAEPPPLPAPASGVRPRHAEPNRRGGSARALDARAGRPGSTGPPVAAAAAAGPSRAGPTASPDGATWLRMRTPERPRLSLGRPGLDELARAGALDVPAPEAPRPRRDVDNVLDRVDPLQQPFVEGRRTPRVEQGRVPPVVHDLLRDVESRWRPTRTLLAKEAGTPGRHETLQGWWRGYLDSVKAAQGPGLAGRPQPPPGGGARAFADGGSTGIGANATPARELLCLLCVVWRPGAEPRLVLRHGSGSDEFDRLALDALESALRRRGTDGAPDAASACYRFAAGLGRAPLRLDALLADIPGRLILRSRVMLIDFDEPG